MHRMYGESNRLTKNRVAVVLGTVLVHGLIIIWALSIRAFTTSAISAQAIQVLIVDKPPRSRADEKLSALQMNQLKPVLLPMAIPHLDIPAELPPPQALASEETSESNVSVVASNGAPSISSNGSGTASNGEGDITVAHRVQPIYSDASVKAREQGYVVVGLLIDEHGRVRKTKVVQSSGFSRLDQSAVAALRQWTFTRIDGAPSGPAWTTFRYGFHLASSSNGLDLSAVTLALLPYDPALAEQIRGAALPIAVTKAPKPHGAAALRRLIATIQTAAPTVGRDFPGPQAPVQLVVRLGAVKSIQFLGFESHGLEVDSATQPAVANPQRSQDSQWELYKVTQKGGTSEWLLDVTRNGSITAAQALTCASEQTAIDCPWPNSAPVAAQDKSQD
jgi:TonB family protein